MASAPKKLQRYRRIDVTYEAVIKEFNYIELLYKGFQAQFGLKYKVSFGSYCLFFGQIVIFRAIFSAPPSKMPSRTPMLMIKP